MKTNDQVAHIWAQGNGETAHAGNMKCENNRIYSYWACIGYLDTEKHVAFVSRASYSMTTSAHIGRAERALDRSWSVIRFPEVDFPGVNQAIAAAHEALQETFKTALRSTKNMDWYLDHYREEKEVFERVSALYGLTFEPLPEITGDLQEKAKELRSKEAKARAEKAKEQKRLQEEQRQRDKEHFEKWLTTGAGHCPSSYGRNGRFNSWDQDLDATDYITIKNGKIPQVFSRADGNVKTPSMVIDYHADTVITSQGAEAPLEHVRKAVKFYEGRKYTLVDINGENPETAWNEYHTNGHKIPLGHFTLDSIDEAGNVKAGCHRFSAAEIARFCETWKEVLG